MAKFDEADPRWLVQDMGESGRNVNNWHWTERDCTEWAKERLGQLLSGLQLTAAPLAVRTTSLESMTGEAFLNVRKNKLIASYDLEVRVGWTGELTDGEGNVVGKGAGKIHFPHVGDDNHDEDVEVRIVVDTNSSESERLKQAVHSSGKAPLLAAIKQFAKELVAGGPTVAEAANGAAASDAAAKPKLSSADKDAAAAAARKKAEEAAAASKSGKGKTISITAKFHCRPSDIFECLTVEGRVCMFTQSPATVQPRPGGAFSWYGGSISGEFVELSAPNRIVMKWRLNTWEEGCFSKVDISITEPDVGNTIVKIKQTEVPVHDKFGNEDTVDVTEKGWQGQVLQRIRHVFGYGA